LGTDIVPIHTLASGSITAAGTGVFLAQDYAMSVANPRLSLKGVLQIPSGAPIPVFLSTDGVVFLAEEWSYDLITDELDVSMISLPAVEIDVEDVTQESYSEKGGGGTRASASSGGSAPSTPQARTLDWFIAETYTEDNTTKQRLRLNPKYQGMYADGWVSAGGLSDGGGSTPTGDYLPLSGGTMTGPISMAVTSGDLTIAESFRFTYNDSVVSSLRASSGGSVGLYANGSIRLRPGGSISNGLVITTTDVTFNGTSLLNGGGSYTLPAATTDALGGVKVSAVETGIARVITTLYGNRYGLKIDADGKAYIDIPSPGTTVSWGNTSNNVSPLTVNGTTKNVLLSGWAPDLSGYLPLTAGSSKPLTGPLNIKLPGSENTYYDYLLFRNSDNTEVASMRVTGVGHIGLHATQAIEFMAGNTRRFTVSGTYGLYPEINGTITLTSAGAFSSLGDGYDIGRRNTSTTSTSNSRFIRAVRSRIYYLTDDVYIYYDTVNNCIRTNAPIVSDSYISAGGVSTT
ncbi:MAG: hypothetical protein II518_00540, partial [Candidatus Methanomethylophilus sp.]|nr:hypothetical protein [Methanomethylophilus sp.]